MLPHWTVHPARNRHLSPNRVPSISWVSLKGKLVSPTDIWVGDFAVGTSLRPPFLCDGKWQARLNKVSVVARRHIPSLVTSTLRTRQWWQWTAGNRSRSHPALLARALRSCRIPTWSCLYPTLSPISRASPGNPCSGRSPDLSHCLTNVRRRPSSVPVMLFYSCLVKAERALSYYCFYY